MAKVPAQVRPPMAAIDEGGLRSGMAGETEDAA